MTFRKRISLLFVVGVAVTLTACGGGGEKEQAKDKNGAHDTAPKLSANSSQIVGTWNASLKLDDAAVARLVADFPDDQKANAEAQIRASMERNLTVKMLLVVKDDFTYSLTDTSDASPETETGTWKILTEDGNTITIETITDGSQRRDTHVWNLADHDTITEMLGDEEFKELEGGLKIVYRRQK